MIKLQTNFVETSFTNVYGQLINVGDTIMYIGTSKKNTEYRTGKYAGIYFDTDGLDKYIKITNISEMYRRNYAILPQKRVFKLEK